MSKIEKTQEVAAAKAGMDVKTARKYLASGKQPSEEKLERTWRTHPDPFERVRKEVEEQIEAHPGLEAKTIFEALQRRTLASSPTGNCGPCSGTASAGARRKGQAAKCSSRSTTYRGGWASPASRI